MAAVIQHGNIRVVLGVPETILPVVGIPENAKVRFRFRNDSVGRVFVKTETEVAHYVLIDNGNTWGLLPQGRNIKRITSKLP